MQFLVCADCLLELLLAYIAPRTHCVTDDFDIEFRHSAESWSKHKLKRVMESNRQSRGNIKATKGKNDLSVYLSDFELLPLGLISNLWRR